MKIKSILFIAVLGLTAPVISGCGLIGQGVEKYDSLVSDDEECNKAWANYDSQLQRRSDLIPNLVAIVKGSAAHEHSTLTDVINARANAQKITLDADDLTDPAKVEAFKQAQSGISGALSKLMVLNEAYPTLQANGQFHDLMVNVEGSENRIGEARRDYNNAVGIYNVELRRVSGQALQVVIGTKTFKPRVYFLADADARNVPKVSFDAPPASSK